ncbi:hypothetical protein BDP27DRAFT_1433709 [Rhodocollybia butyracea]|uniref:Uncharacterized protein n=1 Tax=Rhodocollybia butyracea TaxID=206335 RepID=A0A9P5P9B6_9AGAR|nr:hypothetical protein BDP27DRAFT_1433709 [Rhodocollybia butyracea]
MTINTVTSLSNIIAAMNELDKLFVSVDRLKSDIDSDRDRLTSEEDHNSATLDQLREEIQKIETTLRDSIPSKTAYNEKTLNRILTEVTEAQRCIPSSDEWSLAFLDGLLCRGAQVELTRAVEMNALLPQRLIEPKLIEVSKHAGVDRDAS